MTDLTDTIRTSMPEPGAIFLTGATGYIGGRLAPRLLEQGRRLRCLTRSGKKLQGRPWARDTLVEIVEADASDEQALTQAMRGCDAAYYLIHSMMAAGPEYREHDRRLAETFSRAAAAANVQRIVYLGGLGETGEGLSEHLRSRREVESALRAGGTPVTTLRAAMIIGSGSASFEILRYLVERLPIMITPRWVATECQPIAVRDVLGCLAAVLDNDDTSGQTLDIGGADVMTYRKIMRVMAEERALRRRLVIPVPVLTPRLSSLWIHLVTPLSARIARPLAEGLKNRVVCEINAAPALLGRQPLTVREAIARALGKVRDSEIETVWSDAGVMPGDPDWSGGTTFTDERKLEIDAAPDRVFDAACRIGGGHGYYAADWLWRLRGLMDRLAGGPGLRRGRRDPAQIRYGDSLDFWRVTAVEHGRLLELRAEMKLPGVATLGFRVEPIGDGRSRLTQTARFKPKGLLGIAYWYAVLPLHGVVFRGMLGGISRAARESPITPADHTQ